MVKCGVGRLKRLADRAGLNSCIICSDIIRTYENMACRYDILNDMNSLLPSAIRRNRNRQRLTLDGLSGITGMSPQHLSEIESDKRDPRLSSIERIAQALGLTLLLVPTRMAPGVRRYVETDGRCFRSTSSLSESENHK